MSGAHAACRAAMAAVRRRAGGGSAPARPDLEHETAFNRLAFFGLIAIYLGLTPQPRLVLAGTVCAAYGMFGILIVTAVQLRPVISHRRRILALVADLTALSTELHLNGQTNAVFWPLYLWIIFGNGFRFGLVYLFIAMTIALAGFASVIATTPYWGRQPLLSTGLLLALAILPAYAGSLIRKLSEAKRLAEEANRSKSRFLANVSHELRTPLNAIVGSTSLLRGTALGPEQRELADSLGVGTRVLLSLIGGILDFSRIEADRMPLRLAPLDLPDLLADIRELLQPQARLKGLRLRFHVTPRVAPSIVSDRRHLYEVLLNLVSNAIKFTASGQVSIHVDATEAGPARQHLRFEVADTGIGIAPDARERIFDSFTQATPDIVDRFGGTGLGLSIARQLVTLMGGAITVDSVPGSGSTFRFQIDCDTTASPAPDDVADPDRLDGSIGDLRIVLLFEDALLAERTRRQLDAIGLPAEPAEDEGDALVRLRNPRRGSARSRSLLLLQRESVRPDLPLDPATEAFLASLADHPVIAVADAPPPGDQLPEPSFRRQVGTWTGRRMTAAEFCLALRWVAGQPERRDAAEVAPSVPSVAAERLHVLVADDNDINLRVVARVLERAGHTMRLVKDGSAALDALEQERFDIVLMDVNMPVMSGLEATKLYRFTELGEAPVPIVALTADATPEMEQACRDAGMTMCLTKPVQVFTLAATLERLARAGNRPAGPDRRANDRDRSSTMRPVFDRQVVQNLVDLGGQDFLDELIEGFALDAEELVAGIADAAQAADLARFRNQTHALRSCAANVGAAAIGELCGACRDVAAAELRGRGVSLAGLLSEELLRLRRGMAPMAMPHPAGMPDRLQDSFLGR